MPMPAFAPVLSELGAEVWVAEPGVADPVSAADDGVDVEPVAEDVVADADEEVVESDELDVLDETSEAANVHPEVAKDVMVVRDSGAGAWNVSSVGSAQP